MLSGLAETWWNSSTAISRSSNASTPNLSTAKRNVAWVQTSTLSSLSRNAPTELTLPPLSSPGALQRFHFGSTCQSAQKPILAQRLVVEARADGLFRHDDDRLLDALIVQLVERDEHQRAALARGRRRLDQQILLAALFEGALLHRPHAELVGFGRAAVAGIGNRNGGN